MKQAKKLLAFLLVAVLVISLGSLSAFADETYSITIDNAIGGETYTAYKIFDVTYSGTPETDPGAAPAAPAPDNRHEHTAYAYTISAGSEWWSVVANGTPDANGVITANGLVFTPTTVKDGTNVIYSVAATENFKPDEFAKILDAAKTGKTTAGSATPESDGNAVINVTEGGYYFVDTSLGSLCSLDTTEPSAVIREKNEKPEDDKKVKDADHQNFGTSTDAQIGDTVSFQLTITDKKGTDAAITLHDKMDAGLTLIGTFAVKGPKGDSRAVTELTEDTDYEIRTGTETENPCTFEVVLLADYVKYLAENEVVTITYNAVLNDSATVAVDQHNKSHITYNNHDTVEHDVTVKTYEVNLTKYDGADETKKPIAGAVFQFQDASGNALWLVPGTAETGFDVYHIVDMTKAEEKDGKLYTKASGDEEGTEIANAAKQFTTTENNKVKIYGLDLDKTYYFEELQAPAGYNPLKEKIEVKASTVDGATTASFADQEVPNNKGTELPSTGGIGTTIFYVVGGVLLVGAGVLLVTKKRAGGDN